MPLDPDVSIGRGDRVWDCCGEFNIGLTQKKRLSRKIVAQPPDILKQKPGF
ncbi:MAG: hypothetical protein HC789_21505 [Microcoleus sp. CSU_2_2]|nr:hypothetical protein [Microcoleus sp. SU_5_3]NJS12762.1 hypothetical protein [Microcoleus sp. CSU_2_2]